MMKHVHKVPVLPQVADAVSALMDRPGSGEAYDALRDRILEIRASQRPGTTLSDTDVALSVARELQPSLGTVRPRPAKPTLLQQAQAPGGVSVNEVEHKAQKVAGMVKLATGVANNAALRVMTDCLGRIADVRSDESYAERPRRPHPSYRQRAKMLFKRAIQERDHYRSALRHPGGNDVRFFRVSDMPDEARQMYGIISDEQYFEFWEGSGTLAYMRSQQLIGSLHDKFMLSMQRHGVPCPDLSAWGLVGTTILELAVVVWHRTMDTACQEYAGLLTRDYVHDMYRPFSLQRVSTAWQQAVALMAPDASSYELSPEEEQDVQKAVEDVMDLWLSPETAFDSVIQAVDDFADDVFASSKHVRKAKKGLASMRKEAVMEYRRQTMNEK